MTLEYDGVYSEPGFQLIYYPADSGILATVFFSFYLFFCFCFLKLYYSVSYMKASVILFVACTSGSASQVVVDGRGGIQSPGYPYDVPEHLSCRWLLKSSDDQVSMQVVLICVEIVL